MIIRLGVACSLLIVAAQWLIVGQFVSHSYTWWLKADEPRIDAGITATIVWSSASLAAVGFSVWAYDRLHREKTLARFVPLVTSVAGLAGFLVFWGMVSIGLLFLVRR